MASDNMEVQLASTKFTYFSWKEILWERKNMVAYIVHIGSYRTAPPPLPCVFCWGGGVGCIEGLGAAATTVG